jgi:hypothetical protein
MCAPHGNPAVIARGVIAAVDVFTLNGGSAAGAIICFAGEGELIFLSAADAPRVPRSIAATRQRGQGVTPVRLYLATARLYWWNKRKTVLSS